MPPKRRHRRPLLPLRLAAVCWASFAAFVLLSEALRRFCAEFMRLAQKV
jgi:hypothetical protein